MAKRISLVVTYDADTEATFVDIDSSAARFPEGLCWDDESSRWTDAPDLVDDVTKRLTDLFGSTEQPTTPSVRESVPVTTKFIELALNIIDPDCAWDPEETLEFSDAARVYLSEYPITTWEIEGAFALVAQFVHDWATGEYSNSAPTNGPASVFTPSSDHDLDVLDLVIDEGPTFE